jgi:photosystem II stability/assembly factor-like uncharacterized protein
MEDDLGRGPLRNPPMDLKDRELLLEAVRQEYEERKGIEGSFRSSRGIASDVPLWKSLGPTNGAGKMGPLVPHPTIAGTLYGAADGGGLWKTTDNGNSWLPLTDAISFLPTSALAIAPSGPNTIYLGTQGIGIVKSTDGGATWTFLDATIRTTSAPNRISVHGGNPNELIADNFRSTDGGDTWTEVIPAAIYGSVTDIVRQKESPEVLYAGTVAFTDSAVHILKSTDSGRSWTKKDNGWPASNGFSFNYVRIAISPSNPQILYASTVVAESNGNRSHIFKTSDGGESWIDLLGVSGNNDSSISKYLTQPYRNQTIVVSPSNPNIVMAGGLTYIRSSDGGMTWQLVPFKGTDMHVDAVDMQYQGSTLWIGNDGGVWSTSDNGDTAIAHNAGLVARQYYSVAMDTIDRDGIILAGSQDNGVDIRRKGTTQWQQIFFGDGFGCQIDPDNPSIAYVAIWAQGIFRTRTAESTDATWEKINFPSPSTFLDSSEIKDTAISSIPSFSGGVLMDPNRPLTLYKPGLSRLLKSTDAGDSWTFLPITTTSGSPWSTSAQVMSVAVSRGDAAICVSTLDPNPPQVLHRSTDGGLTWQGSPLLDNNFFQTLEFDSSSSLTIYGTTPIAIMASTDGGSSWSTLSLKLPPGLYYRVVRVDPVDSNTIYCGTDLGLYQSTDRGVTWGRLGVGLPNSPVQDIQMSIDGSFLRVATYGRGIWELQVRPSSQFKPQIISASVEGKALIVLGKFFDAGARILVDEERQKTANDSLSPRTQLIAKKAGKNISRGQTVVLKVANSSGQVSDAFTYTRPSG